MTRQAECGRPSKARRFQKIQDEGWLDGRGGPRKSEATHGCSAVVLFLSGTGCSCDD
jgi:hypothetical protein